MQGFWQRNDEARLKQTYVMHVGRFKHILVGTAIPLTPVLQIPFDWILINQSVFPRIWICMLRGAEDVREEGFAPWQFCTLRQIRKRKIRTRPEWQAGLRLLAILGTKCWTTANRCTDKSVCCEHVHFCPALFLRRLHLNERLARRNRCRAFSFPVEPSVGPQRCL